MAGSTGLEPATSGVTGRRSNQLNYDPAWGSTEYCKWKVESEKSKLSTLTFYFPPFYLVGGTGIEPVTAGV